MTEYAIKLENITKKFDNFTAVNDITLKIEKGEIFGLLGPNGAGKSTTINMILGLLPATKGRIFVEGKDISKHATEAKQDIGLVLQETIVEPELTAEQNLRLFARLYHVPESEIDKQIDFLLDLAGLTQFKKAYVGTFSGGMKRRLETVKSLIHNPKILVLDEPTTGLDVQNRAKVWALIRKINKEQKVTILMTTQYLEEADAICNRIAIIDHGKVMALGTPTELKHSIGKGSTLEIASDRQDLEAVADVVKKVLGQTPSVLGDRVVASIGGSDAVKKMEQVMNELSSKKIEISGINMHEPTLDDVFLKLTGTSLRDTASANVESARSMLMRRGR
ncbi:MAG: ATP-binding cassette domain-containing protein [Candidatus Micrarchaeaceae archaeon]